VKAQSEEWIEADVIDLRRLLAYLWRRRWLLILSVVSVASVFAVAAFVMRPVYRATTVLLPVSSERNNLTSSLSSALGSLGGLASLAGVNIGGSDPATQEALAVLRSREFTEEYIHDRNLAPKLFSRKWNAAAGKWRVKPEDQPTPAQAFKYFDRQVRSVIQDQKTGLISLQIDWRDRNEAAMWANELAQRLNAEMRGRAISKADASLGFLEKELTSVAAVETRGSINRLIEMQIGKRMLADVSPDYAFRIVDRAMAPDEDDPIWPQKLLLIATGTVLGLAIGVAIALFTAPAGLAARRTA
jgi:uncharacterized protein involved in exopolysaccharide biosynthesis